MIARFFLAGAGAALLSACAAGVERPRIFSPGSAGYIAEDDLDVPYVPTPRPVVARMLELAEVGPRDYLIDLGSGDGRIAIAAAQRGARALGVDIDPYRIAEATAAAEFEGLGHRAQFRRQDLFDTPIRDASVVAMYLLPDINLRLRPRLLTELRPGTRVVSHVFDMGEWRPDVHEQLNGSNIYLWIVPAAVGGRWSLTTADGRTLPLLIEQRFQEVGGTLGGDPLERAELRGERLQFSVEGTAYSGIVDGAEITPDPQSNASAAWRARRIG